MSATIAKQILNKTTKKPPNELARYLQISMKSLDQRNFKELTVYLGLFYYRDLPQQNKISIHVPFGENGPVL